MQQLQLFDALYNRTCSCICTLAETLQSAPKKHKNQLQTHLLFSKAPRELKLRESMRSM